MPQRLIFPPRLKPVLQRLRQHRRLLAVWLGSLGALATALAVGAAVTGGGTLSSSHAEPPGPLDRSHPCTWYTPPAVSPGAYRFVQIGAFGHELTLKVPSPKHDDVVQRGFEESVNRGLEHAVKEGGVAIRDDVSRLAHTVTHGIHISNTSNARQQRPTLPPFPTAIPDPVVNAPSPARAGAH